MTNNDDPRRSPTSVVDLPETSTRKLNCNSGWRELDNKNENDLIIIKKLRDYWQKDMSPDNKEKVWSYLTNSLKLTEMIVASGVKLSS